eukprot:528022-Amphidinium_carterae.1
MTDSDISQLASLRRICLKRGLTPQDITAIESRFSENLKAKVQSCKTNEALKLALHDDLFPPESRPDNHAVMVDKLTTVLADMKGAGMDLSSSNPDNKQTSSASGTQADST